MIRSVGALFPLSVLLLLRQPKDVIPVFRFWFLFRTCCFVVFIHRDVAYSRDPSVVREYRLLFALEPEVTESGEFYAVNDQIRRWSSLSEGECQRFVEDGVLNKFEMM